MHAYAGIQGMFKVFFILSLLMENTFQYNISPIYYSNLSLYCGIVTSPNVLNYTTVAYHCSVVLSPVLMY